MDGFIEGVVKKLERQLYEITVAKNELERQRAAGATAGAGSSRPPPPPPVGAPQINGSTWLGRGAIVPARARRWRQRYCHVCCVNEVDNDPCVCVCVCR